MIDSAPSIADGGGPLNAACAALIERMRQHDEAALAEFYDKTLGKSYALALQITGNPEDAEDAIAETYVQVWRDAGSYDPSRGRALAWLLNICRSRAIDQLRRRDRAHMHPDPDSLRSVEEDSDPEWTQDPLLQIMDRDEHAALAEALSSLNDTSRQLLGLAFFRGLTHQEIANITELPLGTVKSHLRRALQGLRGTLQGSRP